MALDKVLINHLDGQDELEKRIDEDIESLIGSLTIQDIMTDPQGSLMGVVEALQERLKDFYYPEATANGIRLAQEIEEDGDIKIQDSNDPDLNEEVIGDKS